MMRSAVTVSLVPEARGGPFVFWDDLPSAVRRAASLGFDAIEIFPPGPEAIDAKALRALLAETGLRVAAIGTGGGWVKHKLHLCLPDAPQRERARAFIRSIIDLAGQFPASAIVGSMQGRFGDVPQESAAAYLVEALNELGEHATQYRVPVIFEPLNRYETNQCNTLEQGVALLNRLATKNVVLLADLFHMNIEETNVADAIRAVGRHVGHVHFVDSNRRPAGCGHTDFAPIAAALRDIGYGGYVSAEAFAWPNPDEAARLTIGAFRQYFRAGN